MKVLLIYEVWYIYYSVADRCIRPGSLRLVLCDHLVDIDSLDLHSLDLILDNWSHRADFLHFVRVVASDNCRKFNAKSGLFSLDELRVVAGVFSDQLLEPGNDVPGVGELVFDRPLLIEHGSHDLVRLCDCLFFGRLFLVGPRVHAQLHVVLVLINLAGL